MRIIFIFLVLLGGGDRLWALESDFVVKTRSFPCGKAHKSLFGSGVVLNINSASYIVTSEHVIYHQKDVYCHEALNEVYGTLKTELLAVDWGTGLAVLKVKTDRSLKGLSLSDFKIQYGEGERVVTYGFPAKTFRGLISGPGHIVATKSDRGLIPLQVEMLEVSGAPGEFGMSGGPVLSDGRFVGMLSHQYIKMLPGGPSQVSEYSEGSGVQNQLLLISSSYIKGWLGEVLRGNYRPYFLRDAFSQENGRLVIKTMGLRFAKTKTTSARDSNPEGIAGIGGSEQANEHSGKSSSDKSSTPLFFRGQFAWELQNQEPKSEIGTPTEKPTEDSRQKPLPKQRQNRGLGKLERGGGDGAGIGGGLAGMVFGEDSSQIEVTLDKVTEQTYRSFDPNYELWFKSLHEEILYAGRLSISNLVIKDPQTYQINIAGVHSLSHMFTVLQDTNVKPVIDGQAIHDSSCAQGISQAILELKNSTGRLLAGGELLDILLEVEYLLKTGNALVIEPDYLLFLQNSPEWKELYQISFNQAVKLKQKLICLQVLR